MKLKIIFTSIIALALSSQLVTAGSITDTYATGDTLTATKLDNVKAAVNDNNTVMMNHSGDLSAHHNRYTDADAVSAVGSGNITFTPPHTSFYQINPTDFQPSGSSIGQDVIGRNYLNGVYKLAGETNAVYASLKIPHASTIMSISCIVDDTSVVGDPQLTFFRQPWVGGAQEVISQIEKTLQESS